MDWYQAGLAEFGADDDQDALSQVHVLRSQVQHLPHPKAGHGQESQQAVVSQARQATHPLSRFDQLADLVIRVKVRPCARGTMWKQTPRWDLRFWIRRAPVPGKTSNTA